MTTMIIKFSMEKFKSNVDMKKFKSNVDVGALFIAFVSNNLIDFIFLFLAVRWDYVDKTTVSFVLVPIIIAFLFGISAFVCKFYWDREKASNVEETLKCKEVLEDVEALKDVETSKDVEFKETEQKFQRQKWIS